MATAIERLLSHDYDAIVKKALCLREKDLKDYYFGIAEQHYRTTPRLTEELTKAVTRWHVWFMGKVYGMGHLGWEVDEQGNRTPFSVDQLGLPMIYDFGVPGHLYKADIDKQSEWVDFVAETVRLVRLAEEQERALPIAGRERLKNFDRPSLDDFAGWRDRINLIGELASEYTNAKIKKLEEALSNESQEDATRQPKATTLAELFDSIAAYPSIMNLLVEKGYCQAGTYIWKDTGKGYKSLAVAVLRALKHNGYYKPEVTSLPIEMLTAICKNTFGINVSPDTAKKAKPEAFDVSFLPPANALNT